VHRTQLYLDDDLWNTLRVRARREGTTISDLVRKATRERYLGDPGAREAAMKAFVGLRADRTDLGNSTAYVRSLRRGSRLMRLGKR